MSFAARLRPPGWEVPSLPLPGGHLCPRGGFLAAWPRLWLRAPQTPRGGQGLVCSELHKLTRGRKKLQRQHSDECVRTFVICITHTAPGSDARAFCTCITPGAKASSLVRTSSGCRSTHTNPVTHQVQHHIPLLMRKCKRSPALSLPSRSFHSSSCSYVLLPTTAAVWCTHPCQPRGQAAMGPLLLAAELGKPSPGAHTAARSISVCQGFALCLSPAEQRVKQLGSLQRPSGDAGWAVAFCIWEFV